MFGRIVLLELEVEGFLNVSFSFPFESPFGAFEPELELDVVVPLLTLLFSSTAPTDFFSFPPFAARTNRFDFKLAFSSFAATGVSSPRDPRKSCTDCEGIEGLAVVEVEDDVEGFSISAD